MKKVVRADLVTNTSGSLKVKNLATPVDAKDAVPKDLFDSANTVLAANGGGWYKYTMTYEQFSVASMQTSTAVFSLPANAVLEEVVVDITTIFGTTLPGAHIETLSLQIGTNSEINRYMNAVNPNTVEQYATQLALGVESKVAATNVIATMTATGDTLDRMSQGSMDIYFRYNNIGLSLNSLPVVTNFQSYYNNLVTFNSHMHWVCPAGVTEVQVIASGGGGGGGGGFRAYFGGFPSGGAAGGDTTMKEDGVDILNFPGGAGGGAHNFNDSINPNGQPSLGIMAWDTNTLSGYYEVIASTARIVPQFYARGGEGGAGSPSGDQPGAKGQNGLFNMWWTNPNGVGGGWVPPVGGQGGNGGGVSGANGTGYAGGCGGFGGPAIGRQITLQVTPGKTYTALIGNGGDGGGAAPGGGGGGGGAGGFLFIRW